MLMVVVMVDFLLVYLTKYIINDTAINCQAFVYQFAKLVDIG
jgi:hypothetical protein